MNTPADHIALKLEVAYRLIEKERMVGVPILNPVLKVQAVEFRPYQGMWLGVMITPWFMNLMLLPDVKNDPDIWDQDAGMKKTFTFPAGKFEFIFGEDQLIGKNYMCALYSPMFEFVDQQTTLETAEHILELIMQAREVNELDVEKHNQNRMENIWSEEKTADQTDLKDQPERSRRAFLGMKEDNISPQHDGQQP
ncbi:[NiFe]-hydrogenase assembly chaperone HybE [Terasakiella sp. SH-1]|uniref:[NiFe]-hydrogenase assembly chaperone HybE n=1 Tax=Terasakiella sp. SH-1 TaxID=2560057 RepID=UPI001072FEF9|nr:[NiFe]-hydrogenase assembly chaperone HybE [Terasakiella sp. SH-1]